MDRYTTFRGDLRAGVGAGPKLHFVTEHAEGQPTALYLYDLESEELTSTPLPCGGLAVLADDLGVLVAGTDRRLYSVARKALKPLTEAFEGPIAALAFAAAGRVAVVSGSLLVVVAREDGRVLQTLPLPERGTCVAGDPTGQWLAVGTEKGTVAVFDGQDKPDFEPAESARLHDGAVTAILFEREELRFFSVGADRKLLTTHARGQLEAEDKGRANSHADAVTAVIALPVGDRVVTGGRDKALKSWPRAGATKPVTLDEKLGRVVALAVVTEHEQHRLATLCDDNTVRLLTLNPADGRFADDALEEIDIVYGAHDWAKEELAASWDGPRREKALRQLAQWDDAASLEMLASQSAQDGDSAVRVAGVKALASAKSRRVVTLLEPLIGHADGKVRVAAFQGLTAQLGAKDPRPIDLALAGGTPEVGVLAVAALEPLARDDDESLAKLVAAFDAPTWEVRERAVAGLESVYAVGSPRATLTALAAASGDVRGLGLRRAFARKLLGDAAVLSAVRRRLEDDDGGVRKLAFLLSVLARPALATVLRSRDPELHRQLGEVEGTDAKPPAASARDRAALTDADTDVLLQATASRALDTCLRGANGLARLEDPRAFPLLLQLSREDQEYARVEVCRALAALGDPRAVTRLRSLLADPQPAVRDAAYTALAKVRAAEPLPVAEAGLTAAHEDVRRRGLQTLAAETKSKPPRSAADPAAGLYLRALSDPAPPVRREAFKAVLNQGVAGGGEKTLRFALRSVHADVRREVLTEVQAQSAEDWAGPFLLDFLNDPAPELRAEAFELLTRKNKELPPLEAALASRYPDTRVQAVAALHKKHTAAAQAVILRAITDADPGVRAKAIAALVEEGAQESLRLALATTHAEVRVLAAQALARAGDPVALPALRELAFAPQPAEGERVEAWRSLCVEALEGLKSLADAGVFPDLLRLLDSPHAAVRGKAAEALARCTPAEGVDRVRQALAHADPAVRYHAAAALAARGDATVHPILFAGQGGTPTELERLAFLVAAEPRDPGVLAGPLDAADEAARRAAFLVHVLLERASHDGAPDLMLQSLSAKAPRIRLDAARGLELFAEPAKFEAFALSVANDRGDEPAWKLPAETLDALAAVLAYAPPLLRHEATGLLAAFAEKESARFVQGWALFRRRYPAEVTAALAKLKPTKPALTGAELRELAFGAYVGLLREQGSRGAARPAVLRVRQTALTRIFAIAGADPAYARSARPVLVQALGDPNQPVRVQAFEHLQALGLSASELGAEALESGHTDLGVRALELLTDGTSSKAGQEVLERVMLARPDELALEAARLLAKPRGLTAVATAALEAVSESLRGQAVHWLLAAYDEEAAAQQALRKAVTSRYRKVREAAALALSLKKDPAAFETLSTLLREATDAERQEQVIEALTALGDPRAVSVLLDRVETDPTGTAATEELFHAAAGFRVVASAERMLGLGARRKEWRVPACEAALTVAGFDQDAPDQDETEAFEKAEREQFPRRPEVLVRLIEATLGANDPLFLKLLAFKAGSSRGQAVDPVLATLASHPDEDVRDVAVSQIGWRAKNRGGPVEPLLRAMRHKNPMTQFLAAEGLAKNGWAEGLQVLLSGLEYVDDLAVRERAVLALGELGDPRALDTLFKLVGEDGHALQEAAAEAVGHWKRSPRAAEIEKTLTRLARSPMRGVATRALVGLRWLDTAAGWGVIRAKTRDSQWKAREVACEQLGYDADPATRGLLLDLLRTETDRDVGGAALDAAARLCGAESLEPFYAAIQNERLATDELGKSDLSPVDIVCERGDPLRMLEIFPRCYGPVQERLEASLTGSREVPAKEATAALAHADDSTVQLAARLLAGLAEPTAATKKALAGAAQAWWKVWRDRRATARRTGDDGPVSQATACLRTLLWAGTRQGALGDELVEIAAAMPDDALAKPLRLDALRLLCRAEKLSAGQLGSIEKLAVDSDADLRTLAAAVLARRDPKRAAGLLADALSDRPTFARLLAGGVAPGDGVRAAVAKPNQQSVVLPYHVAAGDVPTLARVAADRKAAEAVRLGAVEALGFMAAAEAEQELLTIAAVKDDGREVRQAAWKAIRRSRRARQKATETPTPGASP